MPVAVRLCECGAPVESLRAYRCATCRIKRRRETWRISKWKASGHPWTYVEGLATRPYVDPDAA